MAFKKTLIQKLFSQSRFTTPNPLRNRTGKLGPVRPKVGPEPGTESRVPQLRPLYQSARLVLFPPVAARKVEVEMKLMEIPRDWITYMDFVKTCGESCGGNMEQGLALAKTLDESGSVIVLGNAVCVRPHQVAKAIQTLICPSQSNLDDPRRKELDQMEAQKAQIDKKAYSLVRRELWAGLGYLAAQTLAFMRLTFWELSWDVMEPICFFVTSFYFMAGYTFFLKTSIEPSFEGFFQSRFSAKQKRLMKANNFDVQRYNQLRKAFHQPNCSSSSSSSLDDAQTMN